MQHFFTCKVAFYPENRQETDLLDAIIEEFNGTLKEYKSATFSQNTLTLAGYGTGPRCNLCHAIRAKAKEENLLFLIRCPYEKDDSFSWRIQVGESYFDISILYRVEHYRKMKKQDPANLLVRTHLAVIAEYYGHYAEAMQEYLFIIKSNPSDQFAKKRFAAVSRILLAHKKQSQAERSVRLVCIGQ